MITYGQVILQSLLHLKMSHIPFIQSCSLLADNGLGERASTLGSLAFNSVGFGFRQNWSIQKSSGTWQAAVAG